MVCEAGAADVVDGTETPQGGHYCTVRRDVHGRTFQQLVHQGGLELQQPLEVVLPVSDVCHLVLSTSEAVEDEGVVDSHVQVQVKQCHVPALTALSGTVLGNTLIQGVDTCDSYEVRGTLVAQTLHYALRTCANRWCRTWKSQQAALTIVVVVVEPLCRGLQDLLAHAATVSRGALARGHMPPGTVLGLQVRTLARVHSVDGREKSDHSIVLKITTGSQTIRHWTL